MQRPGFNSWVGKISWQPTPVFLPGECPWTEKSGGQRSPCIEINKPPSCKESDRTEQPSTEKSLLLQYLIHCAENYFLTYLIFLRLYGSLRIETMFLFIFQLLGTKSYLIHISFVKVKVAQSCPTLCHPMDYTVHGILQARILEWVAVPFSKGSSQPRD